MEDGNVVASGYSLAHLNKYRGDKAEASERQQLRRMKRQKEAGCGWSMGKRRIGGRIDVVMVASLFQRIEEILTRNEFEQQEKEN
jgi:hypothetical protein